MKDFELDLQLFADEQSDEELDEKVDESEESSDDEQDPEIALDDEGNLIFGDDKDEEHSDEDDAKAKQKPDEQAPQKVKLTIDGKEREFTVEELEKGVMFQEDYTRKTQALADEKRKLGVVPEGTEQSTKPSGTQVSGELTPRQFAQRVSQIALAAVQEDFKDDADFDPEYLTPEQSAAFQIHTSNILKALEENEVKTREVTKFVGKLKAKEPKFDDIVEHIKQTRDAWPYKDVVRFEQAMAENDFDVLSEIYEAQRVAFYNSKGLQAPGAKPAPKGNPPTGNPPTRKPAPPFMERGGVEDTDGQPKKRDARVLRDMKSDDQVKWIMENVKLV